ncbi:transcriptional regulation of mitochondrial recombination-domain-containing protein [Pestalotiopsis sp. NC0098]|nr:transcriptional regulation of mitochondrial recombination-domain-containing protein [Pestalotiopsis sp. NC0098]
MNVNNSLRPLGSLTAQMGRLSVGLSRTSIRAASTIETTPEVVKTETKQPKKKKKKKQQKQRIEPDFLPGHGEKIWIFNHFVSGLTVYSHSPVLKANKALRQLPFTGKKLKPSKLRKDYWRPMAMVQFPEGMGHIGRSVFHIMRELRMQHDLAWPDKMLKDEDTNRSLTRLERGEKLNKEQKPNSIADMAAVLGGLGKGNKMWLPVAEGVTTELVDTSGSTRTNEESGTTEGLLRTTVFWENELDKNFAKEWPSNVAHHSFADAVGVPINQAEESTEIAPEELLASEEQPKKTSWFGS